MNTLTFFNALRRLAAAGLAGLLVLGAQAQVTLVKDINPGANGSEPTDLVDVNGTLYFAADGPGGTELWKSNGTAAGTVRVKDINPGPSGSEPYGFVALNGALYFSANDGTHGYELWKTDGTEAGTVLVKDIAPGEDSSFPSETIVFNGALYFEASSPGIWNEPWKSDGTEAGTVFLKDINPGNSDSFPSRFIVFNGALYFSATDGTHGFELWKSDGTEAGTVRVTDINPDGGDSNPGEFVVFNGALYFRANDGTHGFELWKSDGTAGGTELVKDINPGGGNSFVLNLTVVGNTLFFAATLGEYPNDDRELWKTDGTDAGTVRVKDINPGPHGSEPDKFVALNGAVYFRADDGTNGVELWKSDGTEAGTVLLKDINPTGDSSPNSFYAFNGVLYFGADDGTNGSELWKSDGTTAGTTLVKDINPTGGSDPYEFISSNGTLFFVATGPSGEELYKLGEDPTPCDPKLAGSPTTPAKACAGQPLAVTFTLATPCPNPPANAFAVQLSSATGSFANPTALGFANPGTTNLPLPSPLAAGTGYRVRVLSGTQVLGTSAPFQVAAPSLSVTPTVSGAPACRGTGQVSVGFTLPAGSCPFPNGNAFTAQLSNAFGSFNNPTALGTVLAGQANALTIPAGVAAGSGYRIRVVSSSPALTSSNSAPFQVKACASRLSAEEPVLAVAPNPVSGGEIRCRVAGLDNPAFSLTTGAGRAVGLSVKTDGSGAWVLTPKQGLSAGVYLLQASEGGLRLNARVLVAE